MTEKAYAIQVMILSCLQDLRLENDKEVDELKQEIAELKQIIKVMEAEDVEEK